MSKAFFNIAQGYYAITSLSIHTKICLRCTVNKKNIFQNKVYDQI